MVDADTFIINKIRLVAVNQYFTNETAHIEDIRVLEVEIMFFYYIF